MSGIVLSDRQTSVQSSSAKQYTAVAREPLVELNQQAGQLGGTNQRGQVSSMGKDSNLVKKAKAALFQQVRSVASQRSARECPDAELDHRTIKWPSRAERQCTAR
eukprot:TRINITY_DN2048_c0_g1_i1.p1 TRINITY_DN2048_c0_g1~~TRINITY_DN2048_c0_g1_i1.p1  ORF type:complete len:105 (+),score=10.37 TRINITY_DN2048_c0_g1_i1:194-508(+)